MELSIRINVCWYCWGFVWSMIGDLFQEEDKARLVQETGLQLKQINNWFINQRKRNWHTNPSSSSGSKSKRKRSVCSLLASFVSTTTSCINYNSNQLSCAWITHKNKLYPTNFNSLFLIQQWYFWHHFVFFFFTSIWSYKELSNSNNRC